MKPILWAGCLLLSGCATTSFNPATQQQETLLISSEREIAMGQAVAHRVEEEFTLVRDPELLERLDRVSQKIVQVADRKSLAYSFSIVEMKEPNAFALPGGPVYVTPKLLEMAQSDDELAAVVAHEVGHIAAKHSIKRMQTAMGMQLFQLIAVGTGAASGPDSRIMDLAFASLLTAYSQADELEADRLSAKYLKEAGFDPSAAITFMERMRDHSFKEPQRRFSYFRTHPFFADRIRVIRQATEGRITFDDYINRNPLDE